MDTHESASVIHSLSSRQSNNTVCENQRIALNFQQIIFALNDYWSEQGCVILQPYDMEVGAGTFHPATFLAAVGPEPTKSAYVQPSRRPTDGRYGENPNRLQHYFQYQVVLKPSPIDFQEIYLDSLRRLKIDPLQDDIRFVEDDWESPTLGAWGLGWEVWLNGMEITQVTYFQQAGGMECRPVTGEITYGLERIAMYVQGVENVFDLKWNDNWTYGDLYLQFEKEQSAFNFEYADPDFLFTKFDSLETQCKDLVNQDLPFPAYEKVLQASHTFNLLDARKMIGVTERARYIGRVRILARMVAEAYYQSRETQGFPGLSRQEIPTVDSAGSSSSVSSESQSSRPASLMLEIGTEELPPDSVETLAVALEKELKQELYRAGLIESMEQRSQCFGTPRRIGVLIAEVLRCSPEVQKERRGPPLNRAFDEDGNPTAAGIGFAKSCGLEVDDLVRVETDNASYLAYRYTDPGRSAVDLIPECVENTVSKLPISKRMRWGDSEAQFVRPVHWSVLLHGSDEIPCEVFSVRSGSSTIGHRFHQPGNISLSCADDYEEQLEANGRVIADPQRRRESILKQIRSLESTAGGNAVVKEALLSQVNNLVEWPFAFLGSFDQRFLKLPPEVLVTSMEHHQKYFSVVDADGSLMPKFVGVANIKLDDGEVLERVRHGNERVLRARLADAEFFWHQDLKTPLEDKLPHLKTLVFHNKLGSVHDKSMRISQLAEFIAETLGYDATVAHRSALLSKADLVTELVGEFPELQGTAGRYYAVANGESDALALAIEESYHPRSAIGVPPESPAGCSVAIADRVDSLLGLTAAGEVVKGDRDPYSLRRMAIAILRIVIERKLDLDMQVVLNKAVELFQEQNSDSKSGVAVPDEATIQKVFEFMLDRLRGYCIDQGYTADEFASVYELKPSRLLEFDMRLRAVRQFRNLPEFENLVVANKRIRNILRSADGQICDEVNSELLIEASEHSLYRKAMEVSQRIAPLLGESDHSGVLHELAVLKEPIDLFFDEVMVMDENIELRMNRVALVSFVNRMFLMVADISQLQPGEAKQ